MKAKILIVEDEQSLSDAYQLILETQGYEVLVNGDGEEALLSLETFQPNLILLDLRMPKIDGIEFLKRSNIKEGYPGVKVIVFSNLDTQKDIDAAYDLGADRYILKAWASPKELLQLVKDSLNGSDKRIRSKSKS